MVYSEGGRALPQIFSHKMKKQSSQFCWVKGRSGGFLLVTMSCLVKGRSGMPGAGYLYHDVLLGEGEVWDAGGLGTCTTMSC